MPPPLSSTPPEAPHSTQLGYYRWKEARQEGDQTPLEEWSQVTELCGLTQTIVQHVKGSAPDLHVHTAHSDQIPSSPSYRNLIAADGYQSPADRMTQCV